MASSLRYMYGSQDILQALLFLKIKRLQHDKPARCDIWYCNGHTKIEFTNHICKLSATKKDGRSHPSSSVVHLWYDVQSCNAKDYDIC